MEATGRYGRVVEAFNPFALGVPGSRTYPTLDPGAMKFLMTQGNGRVLTVIQSGNTITWSFADAFEWPEFSNAASLTVFIG